MCFYLHETKQELLKYKLLDQNMLESFHTINGFLDIKLCQVLIDV